MLCANRLSDVLFRHEQQKLSREDINSLLADTAGAGSSGDRRCERETLRHCPMLARTFYLRGVSYRHSIDNYFKQLLA